MNLRVYYTSQLDSAKGELADRQQRLFHCLDTLCISYHKIDVSQEGLHFLQANSPAGIKLPQLFDHHRFLGTFDDFEGAVQAQRLHDFFYSNIQSSYSGHHH